MKYFHLIWAALFRSKTRTLLTLLSVVAAFLLFGMLDSVRVAFNAGGTVDGANRLIVASRLSITQSLPVRLQAEIEAIPGVENVTYAMWFGGIYQDQRNFFPNFSVAPNFFDVYGEYEVPPDQLQARFAAAGAAGAASLVTSCGTGVTACILTLGAVRAGLPEPAVYDGSWTEWASRPETMKVNS